MRFCVGKSSIYRFLSEQKEKKANVVTRRRTEYITSRRHKYDDSLSVVYVRLNDLFSAEDNASYTGIVLARVNEDPEPPEFERTALRRLLTD